VRWNTTITNHQHSLTRCDRAKNQQEKGEFNGFTDKQNILLSPFLLFVPEHNRSVAVAVVD
jgi:hypothetical protein